MVAIVENIDSSLINGIDVEVDGLTLKNHKLEYIYKDLTLDKYNELVQLCVIRPSDFKLDDMFDSETIKSMTMFDLGCMFMDFRQKFIDFLNTFTYHTWEFNDVFNEYVAHISDTERIRITRKNFQTIFDVVKKMQDLPDRYIERVKASDEISRILDEFEEFNRKTGHQSKENRITLDSIISAVTVRHHTYNYFNIFDLTVYQLMKTYRQIEKDDQWNYIMTGAHAGTIDSSKLDLQKLHWASNQD